MPTTSFPVDQFGGLDLLHDPTEIGATGATALSNLALDVPGRIRTRDGYEAFSTTSTVPLVLHNYTVANPLKTHLVSSSGTKLEVFEQSNGSQVASGTVTPGVGPHAMTTYGKPGVTAVYATNSADTLLRKWSGSAWSTVAGSPVGNAIAVTASSDRLVVGGTNGGDRVSFSDAGDPETYGANNWVDLHPNDGQYITQVQSYQDRTFVFKQRKLFVFTRESTLSDGSPVFNYYAVQGVGAIPGVGAAVSTPQGVYFISDDGIYLTTGSSPVRVDGRLQPLWGTGIVGLVGGTLAWHKDRLIVQLGVVNGAPAVYVYYPITDSWSQWSVHATKNGGGFVGALTTASLNVTTASLWFVNGTDSAIYRMAPTLTTDAGAAVAWSYTSGLYDMGQPGLQKWLQQTEVWGTGTVTHQGVVYGGRPSHVADPGSTLTLGTAPTADYDVNTFGPSGVFFQHVLSGTGRASVNRIVHKINHTSER